MVFYFDKDLASAPPMPDGRSIEEYITQAWESRPKAITKSVADCCLRSRLPCVALLLAQSRPLSSSLRSHRVVWLSIPVAASMAASSSCRPRFRTRRTATPRARACRCARASAACVCAVVWPLALACGAACALLAYNQELRISLRFAAFAALCAAHAAGRRVRPLLANGARCAAGPGQIPIALSLAADSHLD